MTTLIIIGSILALIIVSLLIFMFTIKFDEQHNATSNALHAKIYNFLSATGELPNNICGYFWNYLLVILTLPFTFPIIIWDKIKPLKLSDNGATIALSYIFWMIVIFGSSAIYGLVTGLITILKALVFLAITIGVVIVVVAIVIGIAWLCDLYVESKYYKPKEPKIKPKKQSKESLLLKRLKDWKNRNCSIINWS